MRTIRCDKKASLYMTWYDFRRELGDRLGHMPLNSLWLRVKPKGPLPWTRPQIEEALMAIARLRQQKTQQKRAISGSILGNSLSPN